MLPTASSHRGEGAAPSRGRAGESGARPAQELDLGALAEDDNGMELLVQGRIVSLALPVRLVYARLWAAGRPPAGQPG